MKRLLLCVTVLLGWPAILFAQGYPTVCVEYRYVPFDRGCEQFTGTQIEREWIEELETRLEEFQDAWDTQGTSLLEATVAEIGKPFRQRDVIATLTLCDIGGSMSHPLLINARHYLAAAPDDDSRPMSVFVETVFHELLHRHLLDILIARPGAGALGPTPLSTKYQDEPLSLRSHLWLTALMKAVYLKLGRTDELNQMGASYIESGGVYGRAWEIIELEGHEPFVEELKR